MQIIDINEIAELIKNRGYMYARLLDANGASIVPFNMGRGIVPTGATVSKHVNMIKERYKQYPDGTYYAEFKVSPSGNKFRYQLNKGTGNLSAAAPMVISAPVQLEKFQTLDEWKRQEMEINRLKNELVLMKMQATLTDKTETLKEPDKLDKLKGFAESIVPIFMPLAENYFKLKDREITLKERAIEKKAERAQVLKKVIKKYRPLPNVQNLPDLKNYLQYFENLNDAQAESELNEIQQTAPELAEIINARYYEEK